MHFRWRLHLALTRRLRENRGQERPTSHGSHGAPSRESGRCPDAEAHDGPQEACDTCA